MTKQELKNGMILETRNGLKYLYLDGDLRGYEDWLCLSSYNDDLTLDNRYYFELDIVKVYNNKSYPLKYVFRDDFLEPIWVRPKPIELSPEEIQLLKSLDVIGFTHIARDEGGNIFAYSSKPDKNFGFWFFNGSAAPYEIQSIKLKRDLFSFVDWKDKEPTNILNLLSVSD